MSKKFSLLPTLLVVLLASAPVYAAEDMPAAPAPSSDATATAPTAMSSDATVSTNAVPMISGGVGEEMDHLKAVENQYNLKLLITEANGTFLSDIGVHIVDKNGGTVLDTVTKGPVLLATLPAGAYTVTATRHDGEVKEVKATTEEKGLKAYQLTFSNTDPKISGDPKTTPLK